MERTNEFFFYSFPPNSKKSGLSRNASQFFFRIRIVNDYEYNLPNMIQQIKTNPGLTYIARNNQGVE